ncbi:MAG: FAD-dependent oxidoreductase [Myxococcota bacterium]
MPRDTRFDVLFEPVRIGPLTARNRFYQVPHCNGMGHRSPQAHAAMRGMKAEGGWAVVSTEEVEIHPSSDISPYIEGRLWDDRDIPALRLMTDAVHAHGALAAIELVHNGPACANLNTRLPPIAPSHIPVLWNTPTQARAMSKRDIQELRRWHREAAVRAKRAGFDIIYVYAGHDLALPMHFLSRRRNHRTDEYGGSLENRARLLRELLEETHAAVGDRCAVALRFAVDELEGDRGITAEGEGREVVEMLAEIPDLWDVNVANWANDSKTARFAPEGYQQPYTAFVKTLTTKPVVGVGRFTSPETMVAQITNRHLDFIGAARPSIADPFLPNKIANGELDRIRECIGCNICVSGDMTISAIRCTQNPAMGEEWRRGWHPERVPSTVRRDHVLVVGAGPAGLEAARILGLRGHRVTLAEADRELGGRARLEATLPGLASWKRVSDYRAQEIARMNNVEVFRESRLEAQDILDIGPDAVAIATGATWRRDGVGRAHPFPLPGFIGGAYTPDDLMHHEYPTGAVVVYDDDHYVLGGLLAEALVTRGCQVTLVTPARSVSAWTVHTLEHDAIQRRMHILGVTLVLASEATAWTATGLRVEHRDSGASNLIPADALVSVTARSPNDALSMPSRGPKSSSIRSWSTIGDAYCPSTIAASVWSGYRYAFEFGEDHTRDDFRRQVHGETYSDRS